MKSQFSLRISGLDDSGDLHLVSHPVSSSAEMSCPMVEDERRRHHCGDLAELRTLPFCMWTVRGRLNTYMKGDSVVSDTVAMALYWDISGGFFAAARGFETVTNTDYNSG
jgi:hypothetical protein